MFKTTIDNTPLIHVTAGKFTADYALDGSLMNPLEAFYAALAGCAAVYAKKACKPLGVSAGGIEIVCKPFAGAGGPLTLSKFKTEVKFPADFPVEHKAAVLEAISHCAVKEVVQDGPAIQFSVIEV